MSDVELDENEFEFGDVKYKAIETTFEGMYVCTGCAFDGDNIRQCMNSPQCRAVHRKDGREVIFVKVEEDAKN